MNFIQRLIHRYQDYPALQRRLEKTRAEKQEANKALEQVRDRLNELKEAQNESIDVLEHKEYYMYPEQGSWFYDTNRDGRRINTKNVFDPVRFDALVEEARVCIEKGGLTSTNTPSQVTERCIVHVFRNWDWNYRRDKQKFGKIEYWQNPKDSFEDMEGDCDDLAILMNVFVREVLRQVGLEEHVWRVRLRAGPTLVEGHAYNIWLHNDGEWYAVESTLDLRDSFYKTWLKTPVQNNNLYQGSWGYASPERSWSGHSRDKLLRSYEDA
jgi:predicted transglutaminase-like cysteine proteinase